MGRGIIRIIRNDANLLGAKFNDILEIKSQAGHVAYAKCYFIHPDDETTYAGQVQIDGITQMMLGMERHGPFFASVEIAKAESLGTANSLALEPVIGEDGMPPDLEKKIDTRWLSVMLEDKPLWKGALIAVPLEGKMSLFRITSIDPSVAIGTMLTKVSLAGKEESSKEETTSHLFGFNLVILFKRQIADYETLSAILLKKGFTKPEPQRSVRAMMTRGIDPELSRTSQLNSTDMPPSPIQRGRIQVHPNISPDRSGNSLSIGHLHSGNPFEGTEELVNDIEKGLPLIQECLEKDLNVNLQTDVESMNLDVLYRTATGKDSRPVLKSLTLLPSTPELAQLVGRKEGNNGRIVLYPVTMDRSLVPKGLIEITINSMNVINMRSDYDVRFEYGLADLSSAIPLVHSSASKAASIVQALEQAAE